MDKRENFRDNLLRADGIEPEEVSSGELQRFKRVLALRTTARSRGRIAARWMARSAAAIAIASLVVAGIYFLGAGTNHVWAEVLDKVRNADSFQYHIVTEMIRITDQGEPKVAKSDAIAYVSEKYGVATEHYADGRLIGRNYLLFDSNEQVSIEYLTGQCRRSRSSQTREDFSQDLDPRQLVIRLLQGNYSELGRKTVNGRTLAGIETHDTSVLFGHRARYDEFALRVWIDAETKLPVRTETEYAFTSSGQKIKRRCVADDFLWDLKLPAALFVPRIPEGFTVWTDKLDEGACVNGFRLFAESAGGLYPSKLDDETFRQAWQSRGTTPPPSEDRQTASGEYRHDRAMDALRFYEMLVENGHKVTYYGDRVTPADADSVLMYWDLSDTERRVLWADLRLETLSVVELADHFFTNEQVPQLVDLLETAPYEAQEIIATYLAPIADTSAIVPLQRCVDRWQGADSDNPFEDAIAEIWRRVWPSGAPLVKGRVVYANGRAPRWATVRIGNAECLTAPDGYFAMAGPAGAPQSQHLGCALASSTHTGRAFVWSAAQSDRSMTVVLDFTCTIRGRIVDTNRAPLPRANVKLVSRPEGGRGTAWALPNRARIDADGHFVFEDVPVGVSLELAVEIPGVVAGPRYTMVGELIADHDYDMAEIVVGSTRQENFNERP